MGECAGCRTWWGNIAGKWSGVCTLPLPASERPTEPAGRSDSYALVMGGIWFNPSAKEYRYFYHPLTSNRAATPDMCAKEFLGAAALIMLCVRDTARQAHTAFRVHD